MRLYYYLLLLPLFSLGQELKIELLNKDFSNALAFQNSIRRYYGYDPLVYSKELSLKAKAALNDYNEEKGDLNTSTAIIYIRNKDIFKLKFDYYTDAIIGWTVDTNMLEHKTTTNQVLCENCEKVGFAIKSKGDLVYVVAKYDDY